MPSLAALDRARMARPIYVAARDIRRKLITAASLGTVHRHRLRTLSAKVLRARRTMNEAELRNFLALWGPAFDSEIAAAERTSVDALSMIEASEGNCLAGRRAA